MQAVEGGHHVAVLRLAVFVGQLIPRLAGDGHDVRRVVDVHVFLVGEAVDYVAHGAVHLVLILRCRPEEDIAVFRPHGFHFAHLAGGLVVHEVEHGRQSGILVILGNQRLTIASDVLDYCSGIPLATAANRLIAALQSHLRGKLVHVGVLGVGVLHGVRHRLADEERTPLAMLGPPVNKHGIVGYRMAYLPVNLRDIVVYPTFACPKQHVGVKVVVVLQAAGLASQRVARVVAVDAERRHAELDPRLQSAHRFVYLADEQVDVATPPVADVVEAATIAGKAGRVGELHPFRGIGIEVVVHVDGIDIVARHNVAHHLADVITALRQGRVEEQLVAVGKEPLGVAVVDVLRRQLVGQRRLHPIRVDPGMKLHAALVALVYHELHGVPIGLRCLPLYPRQVTAPGLKLRGIERVGLGAHLEDDGIDARLLQGVELADEGGLHLRGRHALELAVHRLNPGGTEFTFGIALPRQFLRPYGTRSQQQHPHEQVFQFHCFHLFF